MRALLEMWVLFEGGPYMRKYGNLPISKVAYLQPKKVLNEREVKEIGTQLHISLSESAMVSFIFNHYQFQS